MDVFSVIALLGGLALFLFGMNCMSGGLEKLSGGKLQSTLKKMTSGTARSLALGAGITIAIQSSSALTVMLVGLVNSGIMELDQTVNVIMGSNIGKTLTTWIFSLSGIDSDLFILRLMKPENLAPLSSIIGIIMIMASPRPRRKDVGTFLVGFGVLMYGLTLMGSAVSPLADMPEFASILTAFENPVLGVATGTIFTGVIQSSAASVGILQTLALTGKITYGMAIPIIMGTNIGTCATALLSSIGVSRNARRVAVIHVLYNIIGTVIFLTLFVAADAIFSFPFSDMPATGWGIALCHTVFNIFTTAVLLPFGKKLEKASYLIVRDVPSDAEKSFLDERLLLSPSLAVSESFTMAAKMAALARETVSDALAQFVKYVPAMKNSVKERETELDVYEDKLGSFLVKVSRAELTVSDSEDVSKLLHCIGNFERIGDHALNISESAEEMDNKQLAFSPQARDEITVLFSALGEILGLAMDAFINTDMAAAAKVEPLEQVIDGLISIIKRNHVNRLQRGECTIELGFILADLITNCERVSDHCSNIAVCVEESARGAFDTHQYLSVVKSGDGAFSDNFKAYAEKYNLSAD